jgi:hypothetical protein
MDTADMSLIYAELAERMYFGDDAVLLAMDTAGVDQVLAAVKRAAVQGSARLDHGATAHQFLIEAGAADVEFGEGTVVWRLDSAVAAEITELLTEMHDHPGSGHHYVFRQARTHACSVPKRVPLNLLPAEATFHPVTCD